jgi:hypothetical protein
MTNSIFGKSKDEEEDHSHEVKPEAVKILSISITSTQRGFVVLGLGDDQILYAYVTDDAKWYLFN